MFSGSVHPFLFRGSYSKFDENAFVAIAKNKAVGKKIRGPLPYEVHFLFWKMFDLNFDLEVVFPLHVRSIYWNRAAQTRDKTQLQCFSFRVEGAT